MEKKFIKFELKNGGINWNDFVKGLVVENGIVKSAIFSTEIVKVFFFLNST